MIAVNERNKARLGFVKISFFLVWPVSMLLCFDGKAQRHIDDLLKQQMLELVWDKVAIHEFPHDSIGRVDSARKFMGLYLTFKDSAAYALFKERSVLGLDNMSFWVAAVYNKVMIAPKRIPIDSVDVYLFMSPDTTHPFYHIREYIGRIKYNDQSAVTLTEAYLILCPLYQYWTVSGDELIINFQTRDSLKANSWSYYGQKSGIASSMIGKFFWGDRHLIEKITCIWRDGFGSRPYVHYFYIGSREFIRQTKRL
jgi:hypothetical protein